MQKSPLHPITTHMHTYACPSIETVQHGLQLMTITINPVEILSKQLLITGLANTYCTYVCTYACTYVHMYKCGIYVCMVHMYVCTVCTYIQMYIGMYMFQSVNSHNPFTVVERPSLTSFPSDCPLSGFPSWCGLLA